VHKIRNGAIVNSSSAHVAPGGKLTNTADAKQTPGTTGLVLHGAARYDLLLWLLTLGREKALREGVLRLARLSPGEQVLDVGCGTGTLAIVAKRQVGPTGKVCGVDASPEMIARASGKAAKSGVDVDFRNAVVESLPFPDARFDVVLSTLMLHHLPGKLRSQCAREIRRVLKPGGRVLAVDYGTSLTRRGGIVAHFHRHGHISLAEIVAIFSEAGLSVVESGAVGIGALQFALAAVPCCE
jgi:ubiquinone/menaquinone biosynthesis C-methylase UbiE